MAEGIEEVGIVAVDMAEEGMAEEGMAEKEDIEMMVDMEEGTETCYRAEPVLNMVRLHLIVV